MELLHEPHMNALTEFVSTIRNDKRNVPNFDPLDGGVHAECLLVLEAPGRQAKSSGFVSRNNPDETARNLFNLAAEASLARKRTVLWNIVPWYLGDENKIRHPKRDEKEQGFEHLKQLIAMLKRCRVVVLMGRHAGRFRSRLAESYSRIEVHETRHPGPMSLNRSPQNRQELLDGLIRVAVLLGVIDRADPPE